LAIFFKHVVWILNLPQVNKSAIFIQHEKASDQREDSFNTAYSLWRVNGYQQGFRSVASFGFGG
jgi:hypothetical protein